ncbi:MAG: DNA (cytosine-5-)-methyltransferase [Proteobacteria bacterium]|nr:MAG: DNA (cytosine-5-)-methyltransferase [Pseudomonadota bacterium]
MTRPTIFAKQLRRDSTDAERSLWRHLRAHRFFGWKFKRQQPIGRYIVDFVCFEAQLVIEVDGGQHPAAAHEDEARDLWLRSQGFQVVRFWNNEVLGNIEGVLGRIAATLTPLPDPLPQGERAKALRRTQ